MRPTYIKLFWKIMNWGCSQQIRSVYHKIQINQSKPNNLNLPYQLPEPWSGDLENAKIIFVGLNPSFNPKEFFPNISSYCVHCIGLLHALCRINNNCISVENFFENRFNGVINGLRYVNDNLHTLQNNNEYSKTSVSYWKFVQGVMNFELKAIFNYDKDGEMGKDCALLEIVPCKSKGCQGNNAKLTNGKTCVEDFTDRFIKPNLPLLLNNKDRLFVFVGKESCKVWYDLLKQYYGGVSCFSFDNIWNAHTNKLLYIPNTNIKVVFAPHPSYNHNSVSKYCCCRSQAPISF